MNDDSKGFKFVVIGGGSGSSVVLRGLKRHTSELTAVVTMFDSGGSSGLLQADFGYPPLGDLRQCLLGLSEDDESTKALREMIDFRFRQESSLNGHSLGNLLLAALTTLGKDLESAIDEMARLLRISGQVIPVALDLADLCAELEDGRIVQGESNIDLRSERSPRIERVFLDPCTSANPRAIKAILDADVVVLGPGDLYTSIIPNLLAQGIPQALAATQATRVYICNLMTKLGETDDFKASQFVREILRYMDGPNLDWVLINTRTISEAVQEAYRGESAHPVEADLEIVQQFVAGVFGTCVGNNQVPLMHEPDLIAEAVLSIASIGRIQNATAGGNGREAHAPLSGLPMAISRMPRVGQLGQGPPE